MVEQQLADALHRWRVRAMACHTLSEIRENYQRDRQPETLQEASDYLERLTQGRYMRVWTPLDEDILLVDDGEGNPRSVDVLSQGTREQLFICLRLALAAGFARRGTVLPLIFDDVLVNFDVQRAQAAAEVMRDFAAAGHQVLLFTCHEHIQKLFKSLKVSVDVLPAHSEQITVAKPKAARTKVAKPRKPVPVVEPEPEPEPVPEPIAEEPKIEKIVVESEPIEEPEVIELGEEQQVVRFESYEEEEEVEPEDLWEDAEEEEEEDLIEGEWEEIVDEEPEAEEEEVEAIYEGAEDEEEGPDDDWDGEEDEYEVDEEEDEYETYEDEEEDDDQEESSRSKVLRRRPGDDWDDRYEDEYDELYEEDELEADEYEYDEGDDAEAA